MRTRRSASSAATAAATGTPIATARMSGGLSDSSAGKNGWPINAMPATRTRGRRTCRTAATRTPATVDSTAASQETCLRVAPTRRIAANRCSRRAADSRVAVAMKISTGASTASATTSRMKSMAPFPPPGSGGV